jgi:hypothetical protein
MEAFVRLVGPPPDARILDLGGTEHLWQLVDHSFDVTILNLPDGEVGASPEGSGTLGDFRHLIGDATELDAHLFPDKSYDVVFSNSVIEHVGGPHKQEAFAEQVRRLSDAYWVQTPSPRFPLEPHTGVPFYWRLPPAFKRLLHRRWEREIPQWMEMVRGTTVLTRREMDHLFPDVQCYTERVLGLEKSYACYKPWRSSGAPRARTDGHDRPPVDLGHDDAG